MYCYPCCNKHFDLTGEETEAQGGDSSNWIWSGSLYLGQRTCFHHCPLSYNPYPDLDCGHLRLHDWGNGAQKRHVPHLSLSGDEFSPRFLEGYKKPLSLPPVGRSVSKFPRAGMTAMWCHILPPLQPDSCAGRRIRAGRLCASTPAWGVAGIPRKEF